jgi:ATP citrate (pro-S)-lyase
MQAYPEALTLCVVVGPGVGWTGMSNELNNILARTTDGVYEGVAIGGDRYPGTTFIDHVMRFESDPACKMILLLGEVRRRVHAERASCTRAGACGGGSSRCPYAADGVQVGGAEEWKICEALTSGRIRKPLVAWCIGTCARLFSTDVQFGHAGALAQSARETADAKNEALRAAGALVPATFERLPELLKSVYQMVRPPHRGPHAICSVRVDIYTVKHRWRHQHAY